MRKIKTILGIVFSLAIVTTMNTTVSVSYTHLDVYKRQVIIML